MYYPAGLHDSPVFKGRISQKCKAFPETGKACEEVLSNQSPHIRRSRRLPPLNGDVTGERKRTTGPRRELGMIRKRSFS